jgi:hypothetical protein
MAQKAKVIEIVGQKLDPDAKYLIMIDETAIDQESLSYVYDDLRDLIGNNFVMMTTKGIPPAQAAKVFEFMPSEAKK